MKLFPGMYRPRCDPHPLAQVGAPLLSRIYDEYCIQCNQCNDQEYFHAHRIARSNKSVLYSGFADAKQLCNGLNKRNRKVKRASPPLNALRPNFSPVRFDDMFCDG